MSKSENLSFDEWCECTSTEKTTVGKWAKKWASELKGKSVEGITDVEWHLHHSGKEYTTQEIFLGAAAWYIYQAEK